MNTTAELGKRVKDISSLVDVFEAQEGEIQHIIGKTGNGKTYEATRRALEYLEQGYVVYTTWQLILPEYYDERNDKTKLFWRTLFFIKRFYRFNLRENWKFLDIDRPDLIEFVSKITDAVVMLDEGQDIFDARERADKTSRKTITRTRHMRKTLIIISQRAQAVDVTARANVTYYYRCVKTRAWFWPLATYFKVYRTEEMDDNNYPIWEEPSTGFKAELWKSHFANKKIYDSYNSWYLRAGIPKSQEVFFEAYDLSFFQRIRAFFMKTREVPLHPDSEAVKKIAITNKEKFDKGVAEAAKITIKKAAKKPKKSLEKAIPMLSPTIETVPAEPVRKIPVLSLE